MKNTSLTDYATPFCPPAYQMANNQNNNNNNKEKCHSCIRIFKNNNYCWMYGHHIGDDHTAATCIMPKPGHQVVVIKQNTMG